MFVKRNGLVELRVKSIGVGVELKEERRPAKREETDEEKTENIVFK